MLSPATVTGSPGSTGRGSGPDVAAVAAPSHPAEVVVLGVAADGSFPTGLLDEAAVTAVRALLARPLDTGAVKDLPRPGSTPRRLLLLGTGRSDSADATAAADADAHRALLRRGGAALARQTRDAGTLVLDVPATPGDVAAVVEGLLLGGYRFRGQSHAAEPQLDRIEVLTGAGDTPAVLAAAVDHAVVLASATAWARDVTNTRASTKTPQWFADQAAAMLRPLGVEVVIRDERWLAEQGFGGVLAVGGGSADPPRLIEAHWRPAGDSGTTGATGSPDGTGSPVLVVGKGITYDTGGYNLKPGASMATMYTDMAGGAAALAALSVAARTGLPVPVSVLVPVADNAVSGAAFRPGDVVVHHGGRSSEITNTDAEGRLVMADALAYGVRELTPRAVVDIATLTGAMRQALGGKIGGIIGDDQALVDALVAAGSAVGERLWQLPLAAEEYGSDIDSPVADAVNSAGGPPGAITAALFLRPFAGGVRWAHLDIAGPARASSDDGPVVKGATGFGARLLAQWLTGLA